jgi:hypothetical protein
VSKGTIWLSIGVDTVLSFFFKVRGYHISHVLTILFFSCFKVRGCLLWRHDEGGRSSSLDEGGRLSSPEVGANVGHLFSIVVNQ